MVLLNPSRVMIVLITDAGRVEQRMVELAIEITEGALSDLHKKGEFPYRYAITFKCS